MDENKLQKLIEVFEQYDCHPECIQEILDLVVASGNIGSFYKIFSKNTEYLKLSENDVLKLNNFEKLQGATDLYSMHIKNKKMNLRILYTKRFEKLALLLCCFNEKADSKETYKKYIPVAQKRKKEMEAQK